MAESHPVYRFGDNLVSTATREIACAGRTVTVEPKVFDLLLYLMTHRDRVVGKTELLDALWPGVIVTDTSLSRCVMKARQAVGDDGEAQRVIRTVHGHGYQFVAEPVEQDAGRPGQDAAAARALDSKSLSPPGRPSLVVLPFVNISGEREQDFLADGLTQDITTELSRNAWLFLISRNSAFTYKNCTVDPRRVGEELGVRYLVEGTVRRLGNTLRVSTELIDAQTGAQVWAERFDRPIAQFFDIQDDIVRGIAGCLGTEVTRAEGKRAHRAAVETLDAWGLVHRGIATAFGGFNRTSMTEAEALFRHAVKLAPEDPRAHAFLGAILAVRRIHLWTPDPDATAAEAWHEGRTAINLAPDDSVVLGQWGEINNFLGESRIAVDILRRATELDPNSAWHQAHLGFALIASSRAEEAIGHIEDAMRLSPKDPGMHWIRCGLAWACLQLERPAEAVEHARAAFAEYSGWYVTWGTLGVALAATGDIEAGRETIERLVRLDPDASREAALDFYRYIARDERQAEAFCDLLGSIWPDAEQP
jgi:TolB-like protein/Flp pilus assembly protein TadD